MKVTLNTILEGKEYAPVPGTQYEVADGKLVKLKRPTYNLRKEYGELCQECIEGEDEWGDYKVGQLVTEGEWPERGECDPVVTARIGEDFFTAATGTRNWRERLQQASAGSTSTTESLSTDG